MTNWEWLTSDKDRLAEVLNTDGDFYMAVVSPWWCEGTCPHRVNGECEFDACSLEYSCVDLIRKWLDAEHED